MSTNNEGSAGTPQGSPAGQTPPPQTGGGSGGVGTAAGTATDPTTSFEGVDFDSLFSSLEPGSATADAQLPGQGDGGGEVTQPPLGAQPPPQAGTGDTVAAAPAVDEVASLREQLTAQNARIEQFERLFSAARNAPQEQQRGAPQAQQWQSPYKFGVAPEVVQLLRSENPQEASAAFGAIMNDAAAIIHQTVAQEVMQQVAQGVARFIPAREAQREQVTQIAGDFYGKYPRLNHPAIKPVIQDTAKAMLHSGKYHGYNAAFRDDLARAVVAQLKNALGSPLARPNGGGLPSQLPGTPAPRAGIQGTVSEDPNSPDSIAELVKGF